MASNSDRVKAPPFKVLVGIDFDSSGQGAIRRALALANGQPSELHIVTVMEPEAVVNRHARVPPDALARVRDLAATELARFTEDLAKTQIQRVVTHLLHGVPAREIAWLAAHLDADLIVLGTHERNGVQRLVLGSVAEKVLHTVRCPVLIDRPKHHDRTAEPPEIEPPCPDCVETRRETGNKEFWCEKHSHHLRQHIYSWADNSSDGFRPWGFSV